MSESVITLFKEAHKISEKLHDVELKKAMLALEIKLLDVQEENSRLTKRLNERAEMNASGPHNYFYKSGQSNAPYCPTCWQRDEKAILLPTPAKFTEGVGRQCVVCDKLYVEEPASTGPAIAFVAAERRRSVWAKTSGF